MIVDILLVLGGLALLVLGGDLLVKGAVNLALRLGITPLVVGLTVVAFGTSAPELLVSVSAALRGSSGIALGNVVGSNIANVLVILGVTSLVAVITTKGHDLRESWAMMMGASVLLIALAAGAVAGLWNGVL
ncbi:MAG: sodium:calcium antiporter, partial [Paracoccus sp. (in: a-proteobacteria)]|nr:sodium:calcium antiporter [Paracoccus sp. (in: a-proteobacteria)]